MLDLSLQLGQTDANKSIPEKSLESLCQVIIFPERLPNFIALLEGSVQDISLCISEVPQKYPYD